MTCLRTASWSPLLLVLASMALPVPAVATDHWDGPAVSKEPAADITDFFVFPTSAGGQERLTLIMSVYPGAAPSTMFSDAVTYSFRLRPIEGEAAGGSEPYFETADTEFRVDCVASGSVTPQTMSCTASVLEPGTEARTVASSTVGVADPERRRQRGLAGVRRPAGGPVVHRPGPGQDAGLARHRHERAPGGQRPRRQERPVDRRGPRSGSSHRRTPRPVGRRVGNHRRGRGRPARSGSTGWGGSRSRSS